MAYGASGAVATTAPPGPSTKNLFLASVAIDSVGGGMWMPFSIIFFTEASGQNLAATGQAMTTGALVGLVAGFSSGHVVDRSGTGVVAVGSHAIRTLSFALYPFVHAPWQIAVLIAVTACGDRAIWTARMPMIASVFHGREVDQILGLSGVLGIIGLGVGAGLAGALAGSVQGLHLIAWLNAASFTIAGTLLVVAFGKRLFDRPVTSAGNGDDGRAMWRDRPYLLLCLIQMLLVLAASSYVLILPLAIVDIFAGPSWLPAASIVIGNVAIAMTQGPVLRISPH